MSSDPDRYGAITELPNGDCEWVIWGHKVRVALSEASASREVYMEPGDGFATTVQYVPAYLDGRPLGKVAWLVSQEGLNDLLQSAQMDAEIAIKQGRR